MLEGVQVFRYEGGDLNYEPPSSAPEDWDGNLGDLIGDYVRAADVPAIRKQAQEEERERLRTGLLSDEVVAEALTAAQSVNWDVHRDQLRDHPEGRPSNRDVLRAAFTTALDCLEDNQ